MILFCSWLILIFLNQDFLVLGKKCSLLLVILSSYLFAGLLFFVNEHGHLVWDLGYGFDVKISKISGFAVLIGSFVLAVIIYKLGGFFYDACINKKMAFYKN